MLKNEMVQKNKSSKEIFKQFDKSKDGKLDFPEF